jgi:long-subunit fatty acid transport protein
VTQSSSKNATTLNNIGFVYPIATTRGSLTFGFGFGRESNYNNSASFSAFNPQSSIVQSMAPSPSTNLSGYSADGLASFLNGNLAFQTFLADTSRNPSGDLLLVPYDTGRVQQSATILEGGGMNHWSFGGAVEIAKDVMVGMSLNFVSGTYTYDRQFTEQDVQNVYNAVIPYDFNKLIYESTISSDLSGFNALFGLMLKKQGRYQIGLAVRTPTHFDINETYSDNMQSFFKTNSESYQQTFTNETKYSITTPFVFSGGVSVQALDWLVLAGDAEYTDWTQMQFNTSDPALLNENHFITTGMKATWNLRGGGEITFWSLGLRLRGGIIMNPSPYVGDPSKYDQMYYTAGVGYDLDNNVTLNGAFALGTWSTFRTNYSYLLPNNNTNSSATSNENVKSSSVVVSLSYRF